MQAEVIQRQYNEVIAHHYDFDPQSVIGDSQEGALRQIERHIPLYGPIDPLRVLDLGVGTGRFLEKLRGTVAAGIRPFGLDLSQKMIEVAQGRLPDMVAAVDDAANIGHHFLGQSFDLVCTHFITGFVPVGVLAPGIWERLAPGGYWSFAGGTTAGFPSLQSLARGKLLKRVFKGRTFDAADFVCNPADQAEVRGVLQGQGFAVCACETFEPELFFKNFNDFYEFAYLGGWLTPIIEALGLHRPRRVLRAMLNAWFFPLRDHHSIVIALCGNRMHRGEGADMRIAIIAEVYLPKVDGVVNRTVHLIRELQRAGDEVLVVCPRAEGASAGPAPVVEFASFPFPLYPEYRIGRPDGRLATALRAFAPDVLHFVNPFAFGFRCLDLLDRRGLRLPSVFSFHTLYGEFARQYSLVRPLADVFWWLTREYHNRADVNLTVSSVMKEELDRRGFRRVRYWPPAVDSKLFHPQRNDSAMRARLAPGRPDCPLLLTVSRLAPEKNVGFLTGILDRFPRVSLAVVGDGPERAALERQFAGTHSHFVGYLKGEELARAYATCDAFVYASETETMGNVVLEAMAAGCAVVVPNAGGIPSLVTAGETGMLYEPRNLPDATRVLGAVLSDAGLRTRLGRAARTAVEGWSWEASVLAVRNVYREAGAEFRLGPSRLTRGQRLARGITASLVSAIELVAHQYVAPSKKSPATRRAAVAAGRPQGCKEEPCTTR